MGHHRTAGADLKVSHLVAAVVQMSTAEGNCVAESQAPDELEQPAKASERSTEGCLLRIPCDLPGPPGARSESDLDERPSAHMIVASVSDASAAYACACGGVVDESGPDVTKTTTTKSNKSARPHLPALQAIPRGSGSESNPHSSCSSLPSSAPSSAHQRAFSFQQTNIWSWPFTRFRSKSASKNEVVKVPSKIRSWNERFSALRRNAVNHGLSFDDVVHVHNQVTTDKQDVPRFMIVPGSRRLAIWRFGVMVVVVMAISIAPLELAFDYWTTPIWLNVMNKLFDMICIGDMMVNFNISMLINGRLVTNRKSIAAAYFKRWFAIDLMSNFPFDWFTGGAGKGRKVLKVLKLPKVLRVARIMRMVKEEAHYFGSALTLVVMLLAAHYTACLWALLLIDCDLEAASREPRSCPDVIDAYTEGLSVSMATMGGSDGWMRFMYAATIVDRETSGSNSGQPLSEMAWTLPPGIAAELLSTCSCLIGLCITGMLFGNIAHALQRNSEHTRIFHERLSNLKAVAQQHSVPKSLYGRARKHYHYVWSCGSDASRAILHDETLSVDLRRRLAYCFYGESLKKVPFLAHGEDTFLMQLCERVHVEYFSPDDRIIVAGESRTELYFLVVGTVIIRSPNRSEGDLKTLEEGSFFGEVGFLFPGSLRTVDVVAESYGWLLVVSRAALDEILTDDMLEIFRSIASKRLNANLAMPERGSFAQESVNSGPHSGSKPAPYCTTTHSMPEPLRRPDSAGSARSSPITARNEKQADQVNYSGLVSHSYLMPQALEQVQQLSPIPSLPATARNSDIKEKAAEDSRRGSSASLPNSMPQFSDGSFSDSATYSQNFTEVGRFSWSAGGDLSGSCNHKGQKSQRQHSLHSLQTDAPSSRRSWVNRRISLEWSHAAEGREPSRQSNGQRASQRNRLEEQLQQEAAVRELGSQLGKRMQVLLDTAGDSLQRDLECLTARLDRLLLPLSEKIEGSTAIPRQTS